MVHSISAKIPQKTEEVNIKGSIAREALPKGGAPNCEILKKILTNEQVYDKGGLSEIEGKNLLSGHIVRRATKVQCVKDRENYLNRRDP